MVSNDIRKKLSDLRVCWKREREESNAAKCIKVSVMMSWVQFEFFKRERERESLQSFTEYP